MRLSQEELVQRNTERSKVQKLDDESALEGFAWEQEEENGNSREIAEVVAQRMISD
jgi:hypothetical protein